MKNLNLPRSIKVSYLSILLIGALFVACEAASNYHLYVSDRSCNINLKYCK